MKNRRILSALVLCAMIFGMLSVGMSVSAADEPAAPPATTADTVLWNIFSDGSYGYFGATNIEKTLVPVTTTANNVLKMEFTDEALEADFSHPESWSTNLTDYVAADSNAYLQILVNKADSAAQLTANFYAGWWHEFRTEPVALDASTLVGEAVNGWELHQIKMADLVQTEGFSTRLDKVTSLRITSDIAADIYVDDVRIIEGGASAAPSTPSTPATPATPTTPTTPAQPSSSANTFDITAIALVATVASAAAFAVSKKRR